MRIQIDIEYIIARNRDGFRIYLEEPWRVTRDVGGLAHRIRTYQWYHQWPVHDHWPCVHVYLDLLLSFSLGIWEWTMNMSSSMTNDDELLSWWWLSKTVSRLLSSITSSTKTWSHCKHSHCLLSLLIYAMPEQITLYVAKVDSLILNLNHMAIAYFRFPVGLPMGS